MFEDDFEVDECELSSVSPISKKYTTVILVHRGKKVKSECIEYSATPPIKGAGNIKSLIVNKSSMLTDMSVTQLFPKLETIDVYGLSIKTLDGIENFFHGWFVKIDTGKNCGRDISKIANTKISKLIIKYGNPSDVGAISGSRTIKKLELLDFPVIDFSEWKHVPIEMMKISGGALSVINDTCFVKTLKKLFLIKCGKFESFKGDNRNILWIIIDTCNNFDMASIAELVNIELVNVVNIKKVFSLSLFVGLKKLRKLSLQHCKVILDIVDLKSSSKHLEEIYIERIKKSQGKQLSILNSGVVVTNGVWAFKNGEDIEPPLV